MPLFISCYEIGHGNLAALLPFRNQLLISSLLVGETVVRRHSSCISKACFSLSFLYVSQFHFIFAFFFIYLSTSIVLTSQKILFSTYSLSFLTTTRALNYHAQFSKHTILVRNCRDLALFLSFKGKKDSVRNCRNLALFLSFKGKKDSVRNCRNLLPPSAGEWLVP